MTLLYRPRKYKIFSFFSGLCAQLPRLVILFSNWLQVSAWLRSRLGFVTVPKWNVTSGCQNCNLCRQYGSRHSGKRRAQPQSATASVATGDYIWSSFHSRIFLIIESFTKFVRFFYSNRSATTITCTWRMPKSSETKRVLEVSNWIFLRRVARSRESCSSQRSTVSPKW